jgi:hypothetical protein
MVKINFDAIHKYTQLKGVPKTAQYCIDNENGGLENGTQEGTEKELSIKNYNRIT